MIGATATAAEMQDNSSLTDSLTGILSDAFTFEEELEKALQEKYEIAD